MIWLACFFGILSAIGGYYVAVWLNSSISAAMACVAGLFFAIALLFGPKGFFKKKKSKVMAFTE